METTETVLLTSRRRWGSWAAAGRRGWRPCPWWPGCSPGGRRCATRCRRRAASSTTTTTTASPASSGSTASTAPACSCRRPRL
uniref:Uncharacterized protein n=1 Tax=Zea mays TaxID=4577 RepID=C0PEX6_MAIZE|nr:unknown [Zea mays]